MQTPPWETWLYLFSVAKSKTPGPRGPFCPFRITILRWAFPDGSEAHLHQRDGDDLGSFWLPVNGADLLPCRRQIQWIERAIGPMHRRKSNFDVTFFEPHLSCGHCCRQICGVMIEEEDPSTQFGCTKNIGVGFMDYSSHHCPSKTPARKRLL